MNLGHIWNEIDSADRMILISILSKNDYIIKSNTDDNTIIEYTFYKKLLHDDMSPGLLAFLDIELVLVTLQSFLHNDIGRHGRKYQRVKKMVGLIIYTLDHNNESN